MIPTRSLVLLIPLLGGCYSARPLPTAPPPPSTLPTTSPLTKPALPPLSKPSYRLSEVSEQTLPAHAVFASVTTKTTFRELKPAIEQAMTALSEAATAGRVAFAGPPVFVYRGTTGELDKPFTLEIGFPAMPGAEAGGKIKVGPLPAMKAVALHYTGPLSAIDKAYDELLPKVRSRKLRQTGESREVYRNWEGPESGNNQVLIAIGVE
jgi:effector-binding domain-containing protein